MPLSGNKANMNTVIRIPTEHSCTSSGECCGELSSSNKLSPRLTLHSRIDKVGAGMSFACAVHCLLMPFVLGVLPLLGLGFLADHTAELVFVCISVALALASLCWGYRTHGNVNVFVILFLSAALIATGLLVVHEEHHLYFVVSGALGITASHLLNHRLCKTCTSCASHTH